MNAKFLIGAFVGLVLISLVIVGLLRGFNWGAKSNNTTQTPRVNLPVVSNETPTNVNQPANAPAGQSGQTTSQTNSILGLTFNYPADVTLSEMQVGPNASFPYAAYNYAPLFGIYQAPHAAGAGLTQILNEQNQIAQENGDSPAVFSIVDKKGNSLETARFSAGSPHLFAIRTNNYVYYVYPLTGADHNQIEQVVNSFQFTDISPAK